jgi:hypothetical protein
MKTFNTISSEKKVRRMRVLKRSLNNKKNEKSPKYKFGRWSEEENKL